MLSIGAVRAKNVRNMILYVLMDATVGAMGWYLLGYGFAFGDAVPGNGFIGRRYFGMRCVPCPPSPLRRSSAGSAPAASCAGCRGLGSCHRPHIFGIAWKY